MGIAFSKKTKPVKGVFEHPADSRIWWINYCVEGRRRHGHHGSRRQSCSRGGRRFEGSRGTRNHLRRHLAILNGEIVVDKR